MSYERCVSVAITGKAMDSPPCHYQRGTSLWQNHRKRHKALDKVIFCTHINKDIDRCTLQLLAVLLCSAQLCMPASKAYPLGHSS
jgi:hypothetical protein